MAARVVVEPRRGRPGLVNTHLHIVGVLLMVLALAHAAFSRYFGWREEFARVSLLSRQMFYVHTFFVALTVFFMGALAFWGAHELLRPTFLARALGGALTLFWAARLFCQFFVYSSQLWRGKAFETRMHWLFALLWTYVTGVFASALWQTWR